MNFDGSEQTKITDYGGYDCCPDWSPDGTKIVFTRFLGDRNDEIYVMNADGSGETRLTDSPGSNLDPNWSPDGTKIVFFSDRDGSTSSGVTNYEIYVMNADGSGETRLTNNDAADFTPDWSPDGTKIAFASTRAFWSNEEIYVMNADGTNPTRITFTDDMESESDSHPSWSPDGTKIAFASNRDGNGEIYVMNADGTNIERLTFTESSAEDSPSWSPDVTKIAFASNRDARIPDSRSPDTWNYEIYVMNPDGSEQTRLTTHESHDYSPSFSPATSGEPQDTSPPVNSVPENFTVDGTTANGGTVVTYNVTAEDNVDGTAILEEDNTITQDDDGGDIDISCDPSSGTEFPIGDTLVECTATDAAEMLEGQHHLQ